MGKNKSGNIYTFLITFPLGSKICKSHSGWFGESANLETSPDFNEIVPIVSPVLSLSLTLKD